MTVIYLNCVKQFFLVHRRSYLIWTNTKDLKNGSRYKKSKNFLWRYVSNSKFDTDDVQITFQIFDLILQNFILYFWDFNGRSTRKEDLQMLVLESKEKIMENFCGGERFY